MIIGFCEQILVATWNGKISTPVLETQEEFVDLTPEGFPIVPAPEMTSTNAKLAIQNS